MTDPKHAVDTGDTGRYYADPKTGDLLISVTNTLQQLAKPALAPAAAKETAEFMMANLARAVKSAHNPVEREQFLKVAKAAYKDLWETRRDMGTRVHHQAEAHILGTPVEPDEDAEPFIDQYKQFLADARIDITNDVEAVEITVLNRAVGYGGTADLWVRIDSPPPAWEGVTPGLWLVDIKTSLTKPPSTVYRDNVMQLAALRYAEVGLDPYDGEHPVPEFVGAAVLNLRTDRYGFIPLPAGEAAFAGFTHLIGTSRYVHELDLKPCKPVNPWKKTRARKVAA